MLASGADLSEILLYQTPPSFYSQIARLVLAEKGVRYTRYLAAAGPPLFETYEPWYLRLNPGGTVPTLVHGDTAVPDSREILHYVDAHFDGPALLPADERAREQVETWVARAYTLPERNATYGGKIRRIGLVVNRGRLHALHRNLAKNPDLKEVYEAKIADIEQFIADTQDDAGLEALAGRAEAALTELNARLDGQDYLCGDVYTLADVVWTVMVARQKMNGRDPLPGRPHLAAWYARMKARPSFASAQIWERPHPEILLPQIAWKLRYRLGAAALVLGGTAAGLAWLL